MSRTAFFLFAAVCAMVLFSTSSVPAGAGPAWTAYETWAAKFTITVTYQSSIEGGRSSMFHKIEGNGTLDNKVITEDANGPVHVSWTGEGCHLSGEVDELLNQNIKDGTRHYERKGSSQSGHDCPVIFLDTYANTYSVVLPFAHVAIEEKTLVTTDGQIAQKDESQGYAYLGIPSINDPCCSHLPLPAAGTPLQHTRTVTSDLANTNAMLFFFEDNTAAQRSVTAVITWEFRPRGAVDVEAVMEPESGYDDWSPEAPSGTYKPSPLEVTVRLHKKGKPDKAAPQPARFRFVLQETSREPGYCLNAPPEDLSKEPEDEEYDLQILAELNPDLKIGEKGQSAESKDGQTEASVKISSLDWGAYGRLKVTATLKDGSQVVAYLQSDKSKHELVIPRDDNGNRVADTWEKSLGIFGKNLAADWDGASEPGDMGGDGDGISLYEKYRGFEFEGEHESLDPRHKYVFLNDSDNLYAQTFNRLETKGLSLEDTTKIRVRFVDDNHWSGDGSSFALMRRVNFNHGWGHAGDQHGLGIFLYQNFDGHPFLGLAYPEPTAPKGGGGTPDDTRSLLINKNAIEDMAFRDPLMRAVCSLPAWKSGEPCFPLFGPTDPSYCYSEPNESQEFCKQWSAVLKAHEQEGSTAILRLTALVITHEILHGIGMQHHKKSTEGNKLCVVRYFSEMDCPGNVADPFEMTCRNPYPNSVCTSPGNTHGGQGCRQQIRISDK